MKSTTSRSRLVKSSFQSSSSREKEKKRENSHKAWIDSLSCGRFSLFIDIWYMDFS